MKVKDVIKKTCDIKGEKNGKLVGFCNTSEGPKEIEFELEDLKKEVNEKNANLMDHKYGFGGELVETSNTALKQEGAKGIFHA